MIKSYDHKSFKKYTYLHRDKIVSPIVTTKEQSTKPAIRIEKPVSYFDAKSKAITKNDMIKKIGEIAIGLAVNFPNVPTVVYRALTKVERWLLSNERKTWKQMKFLDCVKKSSNGGKKDNK